MQYVYICKNGNNEELRYSIRSVIKNLPEGRICLVGGKPDWYKGDWIKVPDINGKLENIAQCWKTILNNNNIDNNFILMNDDFFILNKINNVLIYHGGSLDEKIQKYVSISGSTKYARVLSDTRNKLYRLGIEYPLDYDIHVPMPINKNNITENVLKSLAPRSMYGNINNIGGDKIQDVKIYSNKKMISLSYQYDQYADFISSEDDSFENLLQSILKNKFNKKTIYEL